MGRTRDEARSIKEWADACGYGQGRSLGKDKPLVETMGARRLLDAMEACWDAGDLFNLQGWLHDEGPSMAALGDEDVRRTLAGFERRLAEGKAYEAEHGLGSLRKPGHPHNVTLEANVAFLRASLMTALGLAS